MKKANHYLKIFTVMLILLFCCGLSGMSQTLTRGDIAIVQFCTNCSPKSFSFVSWVPILNGTSVKFTNNRWGSTGSANTANNAQATQQGIIWTNNTGNTIAAGTVITFSGSGGTGSVNLGSVTPLASGSGGNGTYINNLNIGGKLFIYQGSDFSGSTNPATFNGTILYGLTYVGTGSGANTFASVTTAGSFQSFLPSELNTSGYYIDNFGASNIDQGQYTGSRTNQSSLAAYQALVANPANWTKGSGTSMTIDATAFTVAIPNYYYNGSGTITTLSSWGTNTNGTGTAPSSFTNAGSTYFVANTTGTVNLPANWTVGSTTGTLNIASGIVLGINGNTLDVTGAVAGAGRLAGSSTSNLTLTGTVGTVTFNAGGRTLRNLTLNASTTATLGSGVLTITGGSSYGTVTVGSGSTLTTGGNLLLASDANGTAVVGNSAGSISGTVGVQRYIPGGRRAFRFFAHPYTSAHTLDELTTIDVTGNGGATNGFTTTVSNNPSAFWYNQSTGTGSTATNDPGWTAFTTANGSGTNNTWDQYEGVRILVRGAPGQGLSGGTYTPSAVTISLLPDAINQGNQVVTLTKGAGTPFIFVGNPYPCQINLNATTRGANVNANFYVWNPQSATKGAYETNPFSSTYILPPYAGFFVSVSANTSITFHESDKSASAYSSTLFKTTSGELNNKVDLRILSNNDSLQWDRLQLYFDNVGVDDSDWYDGVKFFNPDMSFYSFSADQKRLALDVRPYSDGQIILLGMKYAPANNYTLKVQDLNMPAGTELYLHDKYLNQVQLLSPGSAYSFAVTPDSLSQGDGRFELRTQGIPTTGINTPTHNSNISMQLVPNPSTGNVRVIFDGLLKGEASLNIINVLGTTIYKKVFTATKSGGVDVDLNGMPSGIYIVELRSVNDKVVRKLIKE